MLAKGCAACACLIAIASIWAGYSQVSALNLRQEKQPLYWPRHRTYRSGYYSNGRWQPLPRRTAYGTFQGGSTGSGK